MDIDPDFYDAELRLHNEHLRAAANVQPHDRVLDVGCGTGQTTREAARAAVDGSVLGVDLSAPMLERARRLSDDAGLRNVTYVQADAQTHPFPSTHFDLCISRFGTMFFADPVAAFTNIGRALRSGARLVLLVWQDHDRNEWATAIREALTVGTAAPASTTNDPTRSPSPTRRSPRASWRPPASPRSTSPTSTSRSSTARTPPPPTTQCSASGTPTTSSLTWTPP
jgi:SAM-dependent methyltransferase